MPLHLLSKKSWNVYSPANIERVRRDEAAAAALEEEAERRMQEHDAAVRLAMLRGDAPPPPPEQPEEGARQTRRRDDESSAHPSEDRRKKRRRLHGEDDTDRDIRLAREDAINAAAAVDGASQRRETRKHDDAPITDHAGHINLFPAELKGPDKPERNAEAEAERKRRERELEDQYTMRFANAAGRDGLEKKPWYADSEPKAESKQSENTTTTTLSIENVRVHAPEMESKDVWGRPDPNRIRREEVRLSASDPMAGMKRAQAQLKAAARDRKTWNAERQREALELEESRRRQEKEHRRRRRRDARHAASDHNHDGIGELEGFSLDVPSDARKREHRDEYRRRTHRDHHRHRSRSRERKHRRSRDRSQRHDERGRAA